MIDSTSEDRPQYEHELDKMPETYELAMAQDLAPLKQGLAAANGSSLIAAGSGGSFTVASILCAFHEAYTGRVSRPSTPLELISNPTLAASSPVFLISAEGKNPDIIEALSRARSNSARAVHVLTNRRDSPLAERARTLTDIGLHAYELNTKDGYLGTNSLLMNAVVLARAYQELDNEDRLLPSTLHALRLQTMSVTDWLTSSVAFAQRAATRSTLIVVFSPAFRPVATDLESKLSEAALLNCQLTDIRSFAHGRHLWLSEREGDCSLLALVDPSLGPLWNRMQSLLPDSVPLHRMDFAGSAPDDLLAGLVAQMHLVAHIARTKNVDPGRPVVRKYARELHYLALPDLIGPAVEDTEHTEKSKHAVLGATWPLLKRNGPVRRALKAFRSALSEKHFRCVVFDYDGVLCRSQERAAPLSSKICDHLVRLTTNGITIGIASGRGGSVRDNLTARLPEQCWPMVILGLYNAGHIGDLRKTPKERETSEYISHVARILRTLKSTGVPITDIKLTHPYQVSVRFHDGSDANQNWFVIADSLRQAGLDLSRVVRSKHSVDILGVGVGKSHLVAHIVQNIRILPYDVLTIGDQGAWPGNDASLLDHRFSVSVDEPSRRLDRGWKLAPSHKRDVDATLWYLDRIKTASNGTFTLRISD